MTSLSLRPLGALHDGPAGRRRRTGPLTGNLQPAMSRREDGPDVATVLNVSVQLSMWPRSASASGNVAVQHGGPCGGDDLMQEAAPGQRRKLTMSMTKR